MESKTNNAMKIVIVLLSIVTLVSCDTVKKRTKLTEQLSKQFQKSNTDFEMVRNYLSDDKSYFGFSFEYKDNKIKLKKGKNTLKLDSISEIRRDTVVYNILSFMQKEGIRDISGNREWIKVTYDEQKYPCFSFWFRQDFNPNDEKIRKRIENFDIANSKNWIFVLNDKWYIKGEACF